MDFDIGAMLQNPAFLAGISGLLAPRDKRGQAILQGAQTGQSLQAGAQQQQLNALKLQQAQAAQNFNPQDYMQTQPVAAGMATPNAMSDALAGAQQMPATLGGVNAGSIQQQPVQTPIQPEAGIPTGRVDEQALLGGGLQAGFSPSEISGISSMMDPATATARAQASELAKPYTLGPGQQRMVGTQTLGSNNNPPPGGVAQTLSTLVAQRDKFQPGTPMYQMLDTAIQKQSGQLDAMQSDRTFAALQDQRTVNNDIRTQGQENAAAQRDQQNQFKVQGQATKIMTQMNQEGLPQADEALNTIEGIMSKYKPGELPGYGKIQGLLPMAALSEDGQKLRQAVAQLANINLKVRSGAAVTQQEYDRFKNELGNGMFVPEDNIRRGVGAMRKLADAQMRNIAAGSSDDAVQAYEGSGGIPLSRFRQPSQSNAGKGAAVQNATIDDLMAEKARRKK